MKRLAVFCDGTWNRMSAEYPSNVVLAAQSVLPRDETGIEQLTFYDEGVGTSPALGRMEAWLAGAFGLGLLAKIAAAYRFLIFNYEPGDEIYIFGFSRGAYTARSLAGMIRKCGIVPRANGRAIRDVFDFYKRYDVHPDDDTARAFRAVNSPGLVTKPSDRPWYVRHGMPEAEAAALNLIALSYVGVWDTVGALGIPAHLPIVSAFTRKKYQFHDHDLSSLVRSARHAVAVDENRRSFEPSLWTNLARLNGKPPSGKYRQMYFPGDHGSVGGGGDIVGLSDNALLWVLEGAEHQGLAFDMEALARHRARVDPLVPLRNMTAPEGPMGSLYRRAPRKPPMPDCEVSPSAIYRMNYAAPGWTPYRPATLRPFWPKP
ncbi:DUF2235 domain-containing protein [Pelagibacterium limicola]|uniref:DUF2235 domain-containing protein n=1 Tax=Pelagibacterium limicola TaxID=2791022 RepID=UPI0018AFC4AC|nr:DUF2235 domain-containing protein [Pelagibacterium limicola]